VSDADDVLRAAVAGLGETYDWAGIAFVEQDELVLGPATGPAPGQTLPSRSCTRARSSRSFASRRRRCPPSSAHPSNGTQRRSLPTASSAGTRAARRGLLETRLLPGTNAAVCRCFPPAPVAATGAYRFT